MSHEIAVSAHTNTIWSISLKHSAGDRTPFTYSLFCSTTKQYYYGVRYGKGCHPDQLWSSYFTSSKTVSQLIEQHGKDAFEIRIRKVFDCPKKALEWEQRLLERVNAINRKDWINLSHGTTFRHNETLSEATKQKMSEMRKGKKLTTPRDPEHTAKLVAARKRNGKQAWNKGMPMSDERKQQHSATMKGKPSHRKGTVNSEEHRRNLSIALKGRKAPHKTEETLQRHSQRAYEHNFGQASAGLIWANDGVKSKRIRPEDLESSGLIRGRLPTVRS